MWNCEIDIECEIGIQCEEYNWMIVLRGYLLLIESAYKNHCGKNYFIDHIQ